MQAVILAGGKGTRMLPLSITRPKPLIPLLNKTLIEHTISSLQGSIDELVIVYSFFSDKIITHLGDNYNGIKIKYTEQTKLNGSGSALLCAEEYLQDRFCLIPSDDLYSEKDIAECLKHESAVLAKEVQNPERFGILSVENDLVKNIEEKPQFPESNLASTMFFVFNKKIFDYLDENDVLEKTPFEKLVIERQINGYKFGGFWDCMDTFKDALTLNDLWESKQAPWHIWH